MSNSKRGNADGNLLAFLADKNRYAWDANSNEIEIAWTPSEILERSLSYAVCVSAQWIVDREVYIPFLDRPLMVALAQFKPINQYIGYNDKEAKLVGWEVPDISLDEWVRRFKGNAQAAAFIRSRLALNVSNGLPMPRAAMEFASMLAGGLADPPKPRKKRTKFHRDCLLATVAKKVSVAYKIPLGATKARFYEEPAPICGCVISAAALHGHGVSVEFLRADTIELCPKVGDGHH